MGQFSKAHQDAVKAKELNSEWAKVGERDGENIMQGGEGANTVLKRLSGFTAVIRNSI